MDQRRRATLAALTVVGVLVVVVGANALGSWHLTPRFHLPFNLTPGTPPPMTPPVQTPRAMPSGGLAAGHGPIISADVLHTIFRIILLVIIVAAVLFAAGVVWRVTRPGRREDDETGTAMIVGDARETARRAVQQARESLRRHRHTGDIAASIIGAWSALEAVAADTGRRRRPEQTASEFTAALLGELSGAEDAIGELLGLYHRARFGTAEVVNRLTIQDAELADELLETIADRLEDQSEGDSVATAGHGPSDSSESP